MSAAGWMHPRWARALLLVLALHPGARAAQAPDYWLEARLEPAVLWVQAQAMYRLRFYQSVDVRDLEIHTPQVEHAELRRLGPDRILEETREGQRYRVIERSYAVTPYASGRLRISAHATGSVAAETSEGIRAVHIAVPDISADVRPLPAQALGKPWLAARTVVLEDGWASDLQGVQQGEVLRRVVRIRATGAEASSIPLPALEAPGFSVHAEIPRFDNLIENGWNTGVREQRYRLVPLQAGALPVPQARLAWWDTLRGEMQLSQTPPRMLDVAATEASPAVASKPGNNSRAETPSPNPQPTARKLVAIGLLAGMAALIAAGLHWRRKTSGWRELRKACRNHDPKAAAAALLAWWPSTDSSPGSLGALALGIADQDMGKAVLALERHLYGPPAASRWDGAMLLQACRTLHGRLPRSLPLRQRWRTLLPPLYRDTLHF